MHERVIDLLPRVSKFFRRDFKQPRRLRLENKYLWNNSFRRFSATVAIVETGAIILKASK